jgi:hypothetical protein
MREPREIRRDPDEHRTDSPRAGPADRGDAGRKQDEADRQPSPGHPLELHTGRYDEHGNRTGTTDSKYEVFPDGRTKETFIDKDTQGHELSSRTEWKTADGQSEYYKAHEEQKGGGTFDYTEENRRIGGHTDKTVYQETRNSSGHLTSSREEKWWTDADGNRRHDATYDNNDAKKGDVSHRETHEVTYGKDSADGQHKAGDRESSTLEIVKH